MAVVITRRAGGQYGFVWSSVFVPNSGSVSDQTLPGALPSCPDCEGQGRGQRGDPLQLSDGFSRVRLRARLEMIGNLLMKSWISLMLSFMRSNL
jgi:hypothetical protein